MREFFFAFIFFKVGKLLAGFFLGQRALKGTAGVTVNFRAFLTLQAQPEKEGEYGLNILCFVLGISWSKSGRFFLLFCYNCSSQERTKSLLWINWETITWKYKAIAEVHQSLIIWGGHSWAGWWECCGVPTWRVASPAAVQGQAGAVLLSHVWVTETMRDTVSHRVPDGSFSWCFFLLFPFVSAECGLCHSYFGWPLCHLGLRNPSVPSLLHPALPSPGPSEMSAVPTQWFNQ